MRHDRFPVAPRLAAAATVVCFLATVAADAPPGPPAWVTARAGAAPAVPPATPVLAAGVVAVPAVPEANGQSAGAADSPAPAAPVADSATITTAQAPPPVPMPAPDAAVEPATGPTQAAGTQPGAAGSWGVPDIGCLTVGALASVGVLIYGNTIGTALTGAPSPALLVPLMVAGYAVGCTVGTGVTHRLRWVIGDFG